MLIRMKVDGLVMDPASNTPVIVLRAETADAVLPIWVGIPEANAIALRLEGVQTPRPMTHDLLSNLISRFGARVEQVVISDLREGTFVAEIHISTPDRVQIVDSRPSDAIALALRVDAPIYVQSEVLTAANPVSHAGTAEEALLKRILEDFNSDSGKYEM